MRDWEQTSCANCGSAFQKKRLNHKFCSSTCKGKYKYLCNKVTTEKQYQKISGNWEKYFARLISVSRKRNLLTVEMLKNILEKQNYKCALSGQTLTCILIKGKKCHTNASIDRISAGKEYSQNNIQLVCSILNSFRNNASINEFVNWCKFVVDHNQKMEHV